MSSGACVWKESGFGFRADESIGSRQGISGRHRPTFLTADEPWALGVAFSTFSLPRVKTTGDRRIGQGAGGDETLHPPNGLPPVLGSDVPGTPEVGRSMGGSKRIAQSYVAVSRTAGVPPR